MKATQAERVLAYIEHFGSITQMEAVKNRYEETCYIKRYRLAVES